MSNIHERRDLPEFPHDDRGVRKWKRWAEIHKPECADKIALSAKRLVEFIKTNKND